ncbi:MAG: tetratricopeptide repeat protein [Candidatus Aminicenantes bacterium]|nr:tetratricopeptide repeat protein [Candidatus Aminicenantes bacterium]
MVIKIRSVHPLVVLVILLSLLPAFLWAQAGRGKGRVRGSVKDEEGNPIVGAKIVADTDRYDLKFDAESDKGGRWAVMGIGSGPWRFIASKEGYIPGILNLNVSTVRANPPLDFVLKKATAAEVLGGREEMRQLILQAEQNFNAGKYDEALQGYQQVLAENTSIYQLHLNIGSCYLELGEYDKAIAEYQQFLEQDPDASPVLSKLGEAYVRKGDFDQAVGYFQKVIEISPNDHTTYYNIAEIYFDSGDVEKAIEYYQKSLEINPDWGKGHLKLGYAYLNQGDNEQALLHFEKFLELEPDSPDAPLIKELISRIKGSSA